MGDGPALLATTRRGTVAEARLRGHAAVVDAGGSLTGACGDPEVVVTLRSCVKPLQALPFVERAMDALHAPEDELAVACASHQGEPVHVDTVRSLLRRAGVEEGALSCGPQLPGDPTSAENLIREGGQPMPVHNNCSGKHAAMLATCAVAGWPLDGYARREHPCQQAVSAALAPLLDIDLAAAPWGIDGCGLPTYGVPLAALARAFACAQAAPAFRRSQDAMTAHPHLVAGSGRFDTALLHAAGEHLTAKIGGAAVWVAVLRPSGPAVALKLEAGAPEAIPPVAIAVLQRLGALPAELPGGLAAYAAPVVRNWAGEAVGSIGVEPDALRALGPL